MFSIVLILSNISKKFFAAMLKRMAKGMKGMKGMENGKFFVSVD
jgi:hypothetical protein